MLSYMRSLPRCGSLENRWEHDDLTRVWGCPSKNLECNLESDFDPTYQQEVNETRCRRTALRHCRNAMSSRDLVQHTKRANGLWMWLFIYLFINFISIFFLLHDSLHVTFKVLVLKYKVYLVLCKSFRLKVEHRWGVRRQFWADRSWMTFDPSAF